MPLLQRIAYINERFSEVLGEILAIDMRQNRYGKGASKGTPGADGVTTLCWPNYDLGRPGLCDRMGRMGMRLQLHPDTQRYELCDAPTT